MRGKRREKERSYLGIAQSTQQLFNTFYLRQLILTNGKEDRIYGGWMMLNEE